MNCVRAWRWRLWNLVYNYSEENKVSQKKQVFKKWCHLMTVRLWQTLVKTPVNKPSLQPALQPPWHIASTTLSWRALWASQGCWNMVYLFCSRNILITWTLRIYHRNIESAGLYYGTTHMLLGPILTRFLLRPAPTYPAPLLTSN